MVPFAAMSLWCRCVYNVPFLSKYYCSLYKNQFCTTHFVFGFFIGAIKVASGNKEVFPLGCINLRNIIEPCYVLISTMRCAVKEACFLMRAWRASMNA